MGTAYTAHASCSTGLESLQELRVVAIERQVTIFFAVKTLLGRLSISHGAHYV